MVRALIVALIGWATLAPTSPSRGEDFIPVHETAVADTEQQAVRDAYYFALERQLTKVAGYQAERNDAEGDVGARFRSNFEEHFDRFKSRYFTPDTDYRCARQDSGRYRCEVEGGLKFRALQADMRTLLRDTQSTGAEPLTFALSAAGANDRRRQYVVNQLEGAFESWGLHILMDQTANKAIAAKSVDFALGIYEVTFTNLDDPAAYDPYNLRLTGSLTVQFKLSHLKTGEVLATTPVVETANEAGPYPATLKEKLKDKLGKMAAAEIARSVNESVVSYKTGEGARAPK